MMDRSRVVRYIRDFQERSFPMIVTRELALPETQKILSIYGPRRSGKSVYFKQIMTGLLSTGVDMGRIVYLNFDDTLLAGLEFKDIEDVLRLQLELCPSAIGQDLFVFLDEPQNVQDWERAVRSMHDSGSMKLYVTGSSAKMLGREIATALRGRTLSYLFLPYSLRELARTKKIPLDGYPDFSTNQESRVKALLSEYLRIGGFPEVVAEQDDGIRIRILKEYFDLIIYRDIVERHSINNLAFVKFLLGRIFSNYSRELSAHRIFNTAKSQGMRVSKATVYNYIAYAEDALAVFLLRKWSPSEVVRQTSFPKAYLPDTGYARLFSSISDDAGHLAENAVFLQLKRLQNADPLLESYYWKDADGAEVDFVLRRTNKFTRLIQVCLSVDDPDTLKREQRALLAAGRDLGCRRLTILTWDVEQIRDIEGRKVEFLPMWKWMLGPPDTGR
jgi:predicted AAA+ superfamily ATPase